MDKKAMRIVYMGTPEFAVAPLKALVEGGYNVVGVVTMPDKPQGRGYKLQFSAVKQYAVEQNLPILQPVNLKDEAFLNELKAWNADIQIVVAFRMLPVVVWDMPRLGTFNLHASLLPQYRGAAPINWAIINGETTTGVTTFFLKHEIDTGDILMQQSCDILPTDNASSLHDKLMAIGSDLVVKSMDKILSGDYALSPQDDAIEIKSAPKIFKDFCQINWNDTTQNIHNKVRGLSAYPGAFTMVKDEKGTVLSLKVLETEMPTDANNLPQAQAGTMVSDGKTYLYVATQDGYLSIKHLQLAGKKAMQVADFLRGNKITIAE